MTESKDEGTIAAYLIAREYKDRGEKTLGIYSSRTLGSVGVPTDTVIRVAYGHSLNEAMKKLADYVAHRMYNHDQLK